MICNAPSILESIIVLFVSRRKRRSQLLHSLSLSLRARHPLHSRGRLRSFQRPKRSVRKIEMATRRGMHSSIWVTGEARGVRYFPPCHPRSIEKVDIPRTQWPCPPSIRGPLRGPVLKHASGGGDAHSIPVHIPSYCLFLVRASFSPRPRYVFSAQVVVPCCSAVRLLACRIPHPRPRPRSWPQRSPTFSCGRTENCSSWQRRSRSEDDLCTALIRPHVTTRRIINQDHLGHT